MQLSNMKKTFTAMFLMFWCLATKAQSLFTPLDTSFTTKTVIIPPSPMKYDVLFSGNTHFVYTSNLQDSVLSKQGHDFTGYIPLGSGNDSGWLIINHEITNVKNAKLGDGGGQTSFKVHKVNGVWKVVPSIGGKKFHNVDFSALGGTNINCGGATTPYGTTLTAEEYPIESNLGLWSNGNGIQDTSDYTIPVGNGIYSGKKIKKFQNYGYMVEANPKNAKGIKKYYSMGRFSHEGGLCLADGKTVYLTDDFTPAVFFKFVANVANDYTTGTLYAYKQNANGVGGSWIALPSDLDSLIKIREVAIRRGATLFTRHEWVDKHPTKDLIYITETGADNVSYRNGIKAGGSMPYHGILRDTMGGKVKDSSWNDYYGRILEFNPANNNMRVLIEGGNGSNAKTNFSNPDGIAVTKQNNKSYLVINEDLNGTSQNRSPSWTNKVYCEIYYLDLDIANPKVDDLSRFLIGPDGCETTGGVFTPDGSTYFVNIQHPSSNNTAPFNNATTIAVTGFNLQSLNAQGISLGEGFKVYPNPVQRILTLERPSDFIMYNTAMQKVLAGYHENKIDVSGLSAGVYYLQIPQFAAVRIIVQ